MATTETQNKELMRRVSEEAWGAGNLDVIDEYFADDFVSHNPASGDIHGPEEYKEGIKMFRSAFPDLEVTVEDLIAEGDKVVLRASQTGTHEGEFMGIEPTGKTVEISGVVIGRINDGKAVEQWPQLDMMGLMQQLGVVEAPG